MSEIHPIIARPEVTRRIFRRFKLHASHKLGQNFLIDPEIVDEIARISEIEPGESILEIGAGIGTLTQGLLESGGNVTAIEIDKKLIPVLDETLNGYENFRLIHGDVLKLDLREIMQNQSFKVISNLPYYITTPILLALLEQKLPITKIVAMVQREVAERMIAVPNSKNPKIYGALSVAVQFFTEPRIVLEVPPRSFLPPPEVDSRVVVCDVRKSPPVEIVSEQKFFQIVRASFSQRRKTILNSLIAAGFDKISTEKKFAEIGIDPTRRGETFSLDEFAKISNAF